MVRVLRANGLRGPHKTRTRAGLEVARAIGNGSPWFDRGFPIQRGVLMKRFLGSLIVTLTLTLIVSYHGTPARADDPDPKATVDKGIKALGGEEKLGKVEAASWKSKGKITFNDNESDITGQTTVQGPTRLRAEFEGDFGGNTVKGVTVLNGDKGWRKFNDNSMELDKDALDNQKRTAYLQFIPMTLVALKGKDYKVEAGGEEKVGDKPAVGIKVTAVADGKDFKLYFDKESGLPVKLVAKVAGFNGDEFTQETTYGGYKDFSGIKKATKIDSKRDGQKFIESEITDFKVLDKVPADTFAEPV
jgi:hypothetical protein